MWVCGKQLYMAILVSVIVQLELTLPISSTYQVILMILIHSIHPYSYVDYDQRLSGPCQVPNWN